VDVCVIDGIYQIPGAMTIIMDLLDETNKNHQNKE
jgi:hypothetical protein|tara:strand:- start:159 stop:263 length:105 start_codon:yes stop_codon:yes gene_type:complete